MAKKKSFIFSDESLNSYGFRVLTAGIQVEDFNRNPIMLINHDRRILPIGRWENLRVDDGKLIGDPVFDQKDELALKVESKVEQNIMNAVSVGIDILEWSEDPAMMLAGQYRPTVTKCRLFECSIVDIGSNANALKLNFPSEGITLSGAGNQEFLDKALPRIIQSENKDEMQKVREYLGLAPEATEADVIKAIGNKQAESLTKAIDSMMELGKGKGFITEGNEATYRSLAKVDFDSVMALVSKAELKAAAPAATQAQPAAAPAATAPAQPSINELLAQLAKNHGVKQPEGRDAWTLGDWQSKDEAALRTMKETEPAKYAALAKAYYGNSIEV